MRIAGDVRELTFALNGGFFASGVALMETIFGTDDTDFTTYYGGIQLESEGSTAITVDLGDDIPSHQFGLKALTSGHLTSTKTTPQFRIAQLSVV